MLYRIRKENNMSATADFARDYNIDVFEVNEYDSCIDTEDEWKMYDIIQFNKSEIKWR